MSIGNAGSRIVFHWFTCCMLAMVVLMSRSPTSIARTIWLEKIALTGDTVPSLGQDISIRWISFPPSLNDSGEVAFAGNLTGPGVGVGNTTAILISSDGQLDVAAREGDPAADLPDSVVYDFLRMQTLSNSGVPSFPTALRNLDGRRIAFSYFSESKGRLSLTAREGDDAPGYAPGFTYDRLVGRHVANSAGQIAFTANVIGPGTPSVQETALFAQFEDEVVLVARPGDPAPGGGPDSTIGFFSRQITNFVIGDAGHIAIAGFGRVYSGLPNKLNLVTPISKAAPDLGPGVELAGFSNPPILNINATGQTSFVSFLRDDAVNRPNDAAIFSEGSGTLGLVARTGDLIPGADDGTTFARFESLEFNDAGQAAFLAHLTNQDGEAIGQGIFTESDGTVELVVRSGDQAPGTEAGLRLSGIGSLQLNNRGQLAFVGSLEGPGVDLTNSSAAFATDLAGDLQLILRAGDVLDVNPDPDIVDHRIVEPLGFGDFFNIGTRSFNDRGQLLITTSFTDRTQGLFLATIGVPEPQTLVLMSLGLVTIACGRRFRR